MDAQVRELAEHLLGKLASLPPERTYLVGICGIPGSGKSSLAKHVANAVNKAYRHKNSTSGDKAPEASSVASSGSNQANGSASAPLLAPSHCDAGASPPAGLTGPAVVVGMDGWHLTRAQLDAMPDPKHAHDRRGAAFTFDGEAFADFVLSLRAATPSNPILHAPTFSHAAKDPVAGGLALDVRTHRLVLLEGLYCNVRDAPWGRGAAALDERWVVMLGSRDKARERLVNRHVLTGVAKDEEEARWRADNNDLPNGDWLLERVLEPARRLPSVDDASWEGSG